MSSTFNLRKQVLNNPKLSTENSLQWYSRNVTQPAKGMSVQKFLGDNVAHQSTTIVPGTMISYFYSPKLKDKLPYYDTFPLCLPFNVQKDRFTCLNLHYLDYGSRMVLLERLMKYANDDKLSPNNRIAVSWQLLKNASNFPGAKHCVKQYLFSHVKSKFITIPSTDWHHVIHLPLARFKKASEQTVWRNNK